MIESNITLPSGQVFKNRLVKSAMTEGLADTEGYPTPALARLYERWAEGGTGTLITGNFQVDRYHLERAGNVIIDREPDVRMSNLLRDLAVAGTRNGTRLWGQLSHAGRQTPPNINPAPMAPSAVTLSAATGVNHGEPVAMSETQILDVVERFVRAARALKDAGFDGVQLHAAHGYLLSQFLSPTANHRADQWGGSLENRARLLLTIARKVKEICGPDFGLAVKLNSADFQRGGFDLNDSVIVAKWLDEIGIDFLEVSGGTYETPRMVGYTEDMGTRSQQSTRSREAYFVEFAPRIRTALSRSKLMVTGGFRSVEGMEQALREDGIDLIGIARPLCSDPAASAALLESKSSALPRNEDLIRIGPGLLSPRSPFSFLKRLNGMMSQAWYYQNIVRLAEDRPILKPGQLLKAALEFKKRDNALASAMNIESGEKA